MSAHWAVQLADTTALTGIAVLGNYMGETLDCETQHLVSNNMVVKHIIVLLTIYFTTAFATRTSPAAESRRLELTFAAWLCYILLPRAKGAFGAMAIIAVLSVLALDDGDGELDTLQQTALVVAAGATAIGVAIGFRGRRRGVGLVEFFIGNPTCQKPALR